MRSVAYNGHDLSTCTTCEVIEGPHVVVPTVQVVPGRAGALVSGGRLAPKTIRVRLFLDVGDILGTEALCALKHKIHAWLCDTDGGVLVVPGQPSLEWHDVVVTSVGAWSSVAEDASCEVTFTCFDPVAYSQEHSETGASFEVAGSWSTWPTMMLAAVAGDGVGVADGHGRNVQVKHGFAGGESVVFDFECETVSIDGSDASDEVSLGSDFFALEPGVCALAFSGCSTHTVTYRERWL